MVTWAWNYMMFQSDAPGILSLCSDVTCLKCEGLALEMKILWCRNSIVRWNLCWSTLDVRRTIFSCIFCNLKQITLCQNSVSLRIQSECGRIRTRKNSVFRHFSRSATSILSILWLSAFSASHIFLKIYC